MFDSGKVYVFLLVPSRIRLFDFFYTSKNEGEMIRILTDNLFGLTPPTREVGFFGSLQGSICQEKHMFFVAPFQRTPEYSVA